MLLFFNEIDFLTIVVSNTTSNQPSWGVCIQFGVVPVTVFFGFGVCVIMDIEGTHTEFIVWLREILANIRMAIIAIIIIIRVSCNTISCSDRIFTLTMAIKMNRVVWIFIQVCVPGRMICIVRKYRGVRLSMWWTDRLFV